MLTSIADHLNAWDYVVFVLILVVTFLMILGGKRYIGHHPKHDYLTYILMGRRLTLPLFVATLVATWYGGIFGVTAIAFEHGIFNFVTQGLFWYATYLIFAFFLAEKLHDTKAMTLPEVIKRRFGVKAGYVAAFFNFTNVLPISYAISLGIFVDAMTGIGFLNSMCLGVGIVCIYAGFSGFVSVVLTDVAQFFVMCLSVFLVLAFSVSAYGGIDFLRAELPAHYFSITSDQGWLATMVWGFIALGTLVDPNFYQRCFASSTKRTAKWGILISTMIWFCFDICTTFGAMYARSVLPTANPNEAYLQYAIDILPHGLKGFFLAGVLATILSTIDSYLFVASNTLLYDFGKKAFTRWRHLLSLFIVGFLAIALAQVFDGQIKMVWKTMGSFSAGALLIPMMLSFRPRAWLTENTFLCTVGAATVVMTYSVIYPITIASTKIDQIYWGFLTCAVVLWLCRIRYYIYHRRNTP